MSKKSDSKSHVKIVQDLNNTQFIDRLVQISGTTNGRDYLINALNTGTKTRAQLIQERFFAIFDAEGNEIGLYYPSHGPAPGVHEKNGPTVPTEVVSVEFERNPNIRLSPPVPPINAEFILHLFLKRDELDAFIGDLHEKYAKKCARFGLRRAKFWYYSEVVRSLWPLFRRLVGRLGGLIALGEWIRRHVS